MDMTTHREALCKRVRDIVDGSEDITITAVARSMDVAYNTAWELLNTERLPNDDTAQKMQEWLDSHERNTR